LPRKKDGRLAGASEEIVGALRRYGNAVGLAFQIVDDVLNLRGFQYGLKSLGEDISHGKVTMPVAKAMSRLPQTERRWLWETISSKPTDPETVSAVIGKLESCCALTSCAQHASDLVESAWHRLDPLLRDSYVKLMLRAFSWYVLERTY
jgi:geranylgeranyl pyrophosphate synthase